MRGALLLTVRQYWKPVLLASGVAVTTSSSSSTNYSSQLSSPDSDDPRESHDRILQSAKKFADLQQNNSNGGWKHLLKEPWRSKIGLTPTITSQTNNNKEDSREKFYNKYGDLFRKRDSNSQRGRMLLWGIILTNVSVCALWRLSSQKMIHSLMNRHFLLNIENLREGRWHTLLLSSYSHIEVWHLLLNCYVLYNFSSPLIECIGSLNYFTLYTCAALTGSIFTMIKNRHTLAHCGTPISSLGASSGLLGVIICYGLCRPQTRFHIIFLPQFDFSAVSAIIGVFVFDLLGLFIFKWKFLDHASHLGGSLCGLLYYYCGTHLIPYINNNNNNNNNNNHGILALPFGDYIYDGPLVSGLFNPRPTGDIANLYGPVKTYRGQFLPEQNQFRFHGCASIRNDQDGSVWHGFFDNGKPSGIGVWQFPQNHKNNNSNNSNQLVPGFFARDSDEDNDERDIQIDFQQFSQIWNFDEE